MRDSLNAIAGLASDASLRSNPAHALIHCLGLVEALDATGYRQRHHGGCQLGQVGQQVATRSSNSPMTRGRAATG